MRGLPVAGKILTVDVDPLNGLDINPAEIKSRGDRCPG